MESNARAIPLFVLRGTKPGGDWWLSVATAPAANLDAALTFTQSDFLQE